MFALLRPAMQCTESTSLPKYRTKTWYAQHGAMAKIKRATSFLNKRTGTQFHHDWKPMQSIIDILHKNFQEDHTNSRRFAGGFLNSRRFPGVVDTLLWRPLLPYGIIGRAIKHPVPDRVKPSFVIFDIRALWPSAMGFRVPGCQKLQMMA